MGPLEPHRFDPDSGRWLGVTAPRPGVRREALTLVTFNLWFGEHRLETRLAGLLDEVRGCEPDLVAFQEVTPAHLEGILATPWVRDRMEVSHVQGRTLAPHGVLLLSRLPLGNLEARELPSRKARKLVTAAIPVNGGVLRLGAVHLESSPSSTPLRLRQLEEILPWLESAPDAVLMGDLNFDPEQTAEESRIAPGFTDLWPALRPGEPGYTEDTDVNPMRRLHKPGAKHVRFDRILLRSGRPGWRPASIRRLGTRAIHPDEPEVFASDHFGLCARLEWDEGRVKTAGSHR